MHKFVYGITLPRTMSFRDLIQWISGRKDEEISEPAIAPQDRRRHRRLDLSDGKLIVGSHGSFPLGNLSYGGLRFACNKTEVWPDIAVGNTFEGSLQFGQVKFSTMLRVCNVTPKDIGCSFESLSPAHARLLSEFLKPRALGHSLREITGGTMRNDTPDLRLRWFQGEDDTQIYLWETLDGQTVKEEFYFFDYMIRFDAARASLQTGKRSETVSKTGYGRIDQSTVAFFNVPSHRALKIGRTILESAHLPPVARDRLLASIAMEERRLYQRYLPGPNGGLRFRLDLPELQKLTIANISLTGIAFLSPEKSSEPPKDVVKGDDDSAATPGFVSDHGNEPVRGELSGVIELGATSLPATVRLLYRHREILGGTLHLKSDADVEQLAIFLAPRLLGQSLEELPPPTEEYQFAPPGARPYLFVGYHNTHLLSLIGSGRRLIAGRIVFMNQLLTFERGKLVAWRSEQGIVFPSDWDIPLETVERLDQMPADLLETCRNTVNEARIPDEVREAWLKVLTAV
ncbi:MAG: PilZ domain-containing protein [Candidatus Riflebacteria bacterium]|nr:PilZ domain-containing protein [Candidatus Riflebacteria bacterium]